MAILTINNSRRKPLNRFRLSRTKGRLIKPNSCGYGCTWMYLSHLASTKPSIPPYRKDAEVSTRHRLWKDGKWCSAIKRTAFGKPNLTSPCNDDGSQKANWHNMTQEPQQVSMVAKQPVHPTGQQDPVPYFNESSPLRRGYKGSGGQDLTLIGHDYYALPQQVYRMEIGSESWANTCCDGINNHETTYQWSMGSYLIFPSTARLFPD